MPSREEIAAALKTASGFAIELAASYAVENNEDAENTCLEWHDKFEKLAAQVENMRCGTCRHFRSYYEQHRNYMRITTSCHAGHKLKPEEDFGCFSHEPKDTQK